MWLDLSETCHILGQWLDQSVLAYTLTSELFEPPYTEQGNGVQIDEDPVQHFLQCFLVYFNIAVWRLTDTQTIDGERL